MMYLPTTMLIRWYNINNYSYRNLFLFGNISKFINSILLLGMQQNMSKITKDAASLLSGLGACT